MKPITFITQIIKGPRVEITGKAFDHEGITMAVHGALDASSKYKPDSRAGWEVTELLTGLNVVRYAKTQRDAMAEAVKRINTVGVDKTKAIIKKRMDDPL